MQKLALSIRILCGSIALIGQCAFAQDRGNLDAPLDIRPQAVHRSPATAKPKARIASAVNVEASDAVPRIIPAKIPLPPMPHASRPRGEKTGASAADPQLLDQGRMIDGPRPTQGSVPRRRVKPEPKRNDSAKVEPAVQEKKSPVSLDIVSGIPEKITASVSTAAPEKGDAELGAVAREFCSAIADDAAKARTTYQLKKISELEEQLRARIGEFELKRAELQKAIDRQDELRKKAEDGVIAIFSRMKPESAASQLSIMDDAAAAAVLAKLNPRTASGILNEIAPAKAARIADAMTSSAALGSN